MGKYLKHFDADDNTTGALSITANEVPRVQQKAKISLMDMWKK
jgi:hypothetical protein